MITYIDERSIAQTPKMKNVAVSINEGYENVPYAKKFIVWDVTPETTMFKDLDTGKKTFWNLWIATCETIADVEEFVERYEFEINYNHPMNDIEPTI